MECAASAALGECISYAQCKTPTRVYTKITKHDVVLQYRSISQLLVLVSTVAELVLLEPLVVTAVASLTLAHLWAKLFSEAPALLPARQRFRAKEWLRFVVHIASLKAVCINTIAKSELDSKAIASSR